MDSVASLMTIVDEKFSKEHQDHLLYLYGVMQTLALKLDCPVDDVPKELFKLIEQRKADD